MSSNDFLGIIDIEKTTNNFREIHDKVIGVRVMVFNATFNNISVISWLST